MARSRINLISIYEIFLFDFLPLFFILVGAMLVAVQMRLELSWGKQLGAEYTAQTVFTYFLLLVAGLPGAVMSNGFRWLFAINASKIIRLLSLLMALGISVALIIIFQPNISHLQLIYYAAAGSLIGCLTILWPPYLNAYGKHVSLFYHLKKLWDYRRLALIWVRYNIYSRYSQTILGILWIILLPLSTSLTISFVFAQILRAYDIGDVPFISFFLSALTFWNVFNQGIILGMNSLVSKMGVITQVYFPREIILISKIGETVVDLAFIFTSMVVINIFLGVWPNIHYIYLPLIIAIQFMFTLGISFFLSYLSAMIRDIPNLVGIILLLFFYLTPILYPASRIPTKFEFITFLNPLSALINSYRDIILYNTTPNFTNLYLPTVLSLILLYTGYKFFKSKENNLADFI